MKLSVIILFSGILVSCSSINEEDLTPMSEHPILNKNSNIILIPNSSSYLQLKLGESLMDNTDYSTAKLLGQRDPTSSHYILHLSNKNSKIIAESAFTKQWDDALGSNLQIQTSDEGHIFISEDISDALPAFRNILFIKVAANEYEVRYLLLGYGKKPQYGYPPHKGLTLLNNKKAIVGGKYTDINDIPYMHRPFSSSL
jgi:hypothetical protein